MVITLLHVFLKVLSEVEQGFLYLALKLRRKFEMNLCFISKTLLQLSPSLSQCAEKTQRSNDQCSFLNILTSRLIRQLHMTQQRFVAHHALQNHGTVTAEICEDNWSL